MFPGVTLRLPLSTQNCQPHLVPLTASHISSPEARTCVVIFFFSFFNKNMSVGQGGTGQSICFLVGFFKKQAGEAPRGCSPKAEAWYQFFLA